MEFGHHPDPAIDFTCEVDCIEAEIVDRAAGLAATMDLAARIDRAMQFTVGGNTQAIAAKHDLRKIEAAFKAGVPAGVAPTVPTEREQTLAGLLKRCARCLPPDHATRKLATDYLKQQGFFNVLRDGDDGVKGSGNG